MKDIKKMLYYKKIIIYCFLCVSPFNVSALMAANALEKDNASLSTLEIDVIKLQESEKHLKVEFFYLNESLKKSLEYKTDLLRQKETLHYEFVQKQLVAQETAFNVRIESGQYTLYIIIMIAGILVAMIGRNEIKKITENLIKDRVDKMLSEKLTDEYIGKVIRDHGGSAIERIVSDLKEKADKMDKLYKSALKKGVESELTKEEVLVIKERNDIIKLKDESDYTGDDWFLRGVAYFKDNGIENALKSWQESADLHETPQVYCNIGLSFDLLKRKKEALVAYEKAIELDAEYVNAWNGKGNALYSLKQNKEALVAYEKAIELDAEYVNAWNGKGNALCGLEQNKAALDAYQQALELDVEYVHAWNGKGNALYDLKQNKEALVAYEKAIELDAESVHAWTGKGNALYNLKQNKEALVAYEKAIELDAEYVYAWNGKGNALRGLNQNEHALEAYEHAIELDAEYVNAWTGKGSALCGLKQNKEALVAFEKAIELDPKEIGSYLNMCEFHLINLDYPSAFKKANEAYLLEAEIPHKIICLFLLSITSELLQKETNKFENELQKILNQEQERGLELNWSFDPIDDWLNQVDIDPNVKDYINDKMNVLKKYID